MDSLNACFLKCCNSNRGLASKCVFLFHSSEFFLNENLCHPFIKSIISRCLFKKQKWAFPGDAEQRTHISVCALGQGIHLFPKQNGVLWLVVWFLLVGTRLSQSYSL